MLNCTCLAVVIYVLRQKMLWFNQSLENHCFRNSMFFEKHIKMVSQLTTGSTYYWHGIVMTDVSFKQPTNCVYKSVLLLEDVLSVYVNTKYTIDIPFSFYLYEKNPVSDYVQCLTPHPKYPYVREFTILLESKW